MSASLTSPHGAARSLGTGAELGYLGQTPIDSSTPYSALVPHTCSTSANPHKIVFICLRLEVKGCRILCSKVEKCRKVQFGTSSSMMQVKGKM